MNENNPKLANVASQSEKLPVKVSVCIVTYNHEKYIKECLESLITQECDFNFEVIIGEDCSTDNTRAIVQEYVDKYPELVIPVFHKKNIGGNANYFSIHNIARGEYIAHMDGDDYALPGKLMAQVNYLDTHDECNIVWHRVKIEHCITGEVTDDFNANTFVKDVRFYRKDILLIGSIGCHSSKMYRSGYIKFRQTQNKGLDFFEDVEQVGDGYATILEDRYGVYRKDVGISTQQKTNQIYLLILEDFFRIFPEYKYQIAANAFLIFLTSLKNKRKTWRNAMKIWIKVNPIFMCFNLIKLYPIVKNFRLPSR